MKYRSDSQQGWRSPRSGRWGARALCWLLAGALLAGAPAPTFGWGRLGHRAAGRFAESLLTPRARAAVRELLEPGETLADASNWPDEHGREVPGSAPWHYVNVPITAERYEPRYCSPRGCVVSKISEFRRILADRRAPRAQRREALRFLVHLIEDLHQPLHVGDRRDRGGNNLQLRHQRYGATNLHRVWDSGLFQGRYRSRDEPRLAADLKTLADRPEARQWSRGRAEDWANESLAIARRAYQEPGAGGRALRSGDALTRAYEDANRPVALERLAQAGVRVARVLNDILD